VSLWIQIDTQRSSNRKTYVLAELLSQAAGDLFGGRDDVAWRAIAIALLDDFWSYVAEHFPNGEITQAHPGPLRKALLEWLSGTEWVHGDVRGLLVKSGHIDRRPDGRLFVHDWMEWTGGSVLKLANDRKRKRLARSKQVGARPRTVRARPPGPSTPGPVLAVQGSAVQSYPIQETEQLQPAAADYAARCVIAVNGVLSEKLAGAYQSLVADVQRDIAQAWEQLGIPIALAEATLVDVTGRFVPKLRNRQPHSLAYFDAAVREAWAKSQAQDAGPLVLTPAERMHAAAERLEREGVA
jgi:hypothetical protein